MVHAPPPATPASRTVPAQPGERHNMKLLLCTRCGDVRALRLTRWTRCYCRQSRGRYCTNILAEVAGKRALLLGFHNASMRAAVWREIADRKAGVARDLSGMSSMRS